MVGFSWHDEQRPSFHQMQRLPPHWTGQDLLNGVNKDGSHNYSPTSCKEATSSSQDHHTAICILSNFVEAIWDLARKKKGIFSINQKTTTQLDTYYQNSLFIELRASGRLIFTSYTYSLGDETRRVSYL